MISDRMRDIETRNIVFPIRIEDISCDLDDSVCSSKSITNSGSDVNLSERRFYNKYGEVVSDSDARSNLYMVFDKHVQNDGLLRIEDISCDLELLECGNMHLLIPNWSENRPSELKPELSGKFPS
jgi:hypothetical protein